MRNGRRPERFSRADNAKSRRPRSGILIKGPSRAGLLRPMEAWLLGSYNDEMSEKGYQKGGKLQFTVNLKFTVNCKF